VFTCVGQQVTLSGPIWQVTSRSCEMDFQHRRSQEYLCWGLTNEAPKAPRSRHRRRRGGRVWGGEHSLPSRLVGLGERRSYLTLLRHIFSHIHIHNITKHKTFMYIFVPFAQLKRLCNFSHSLWGLGTQALLWLRLSVSLRDLLFLT